MYCYDCSSFIKKPGLTLKDYFKIANIIIVIVVKTVNYGQEQHVFPKIIMLFFINIAINKLYSITYLPTLFNSIVIDVLQITKDDWELIHTKNIKMYLM